MAIKGSLKEASLPDVIQLLFLGRRTGCLALADRHNFGTIYLDEGQITFATVRIYGTGSAQERVIFNAPTYTVGEADGSVTVRVLRPGTAPATGASPPAHFWARSSTAPLPGSASSSPRSERPSAGEAPGGHPERRQATRGPAVAGGGAVRRGVPG